MEERGEESNQKRAMDWIRAKYDGGQEPRYYIEKTIFFT